MPTPAKITGFTLIELLSALLITGIIMGIAVPNLANALEGARASDAKMGLLSSATLAISRAAVTQRHTVLCPSSNGAACDDTPDWSEGWIAFVDRDNNRERDAGETLIYRQAKLSGKVRLRSTVGRTRLVIQPTGSNAGSNVTFTLCDRRGPDRAESIVLNNQGRLRYGTPSASAIASTCP